MYDAMKRISRGGWDTSTMKRTSRVPLPHKMCRFQVGEDDLLTGEDFSRSIGNGIGRVDTTIQTQIAILEQRIARVEAQMEGDYELLNVEIHSWVSDYMLYD
ncbi:hypothetical protein LguiB_017623 [Lonicera macranthoides]